MVEILEKLLSLLLYLLVYSAALLFFCHADKCYLCGRNKSASYSVAGGLLVLCLFAGMRAETVGTDILVYAKPAFEKALLSSSMSDFMATVTSLEPLYKFIMYVCAKATHSFVLFLFITQLLVLLPLVYASVLNRGNISIANSMAIFLLMYYPMSFNIMRQSIAASWFLLAVVCFFCNKKKNGIVFSLVSIIFHTSAVIGFGFFLIVYLVMKIRRPVARFVIISFCSLIAIAMAVNWEMIAMFLVKATEGISGRLSYYISIFVGGMSNVRKGQEYYFQTGTYSVMQVLLRACSYLIPVVLVKNQNNTISFLKYCAYINFFVYTACLLVFHTTYGYRITMFMDFLNILYLGQVLKHRKFNRGKVSVFVLIVYLYIFAYFFFEYFWFGAHAAIPYQFG